MKVLMISEYFPPYSKGGGELSAFALAKELAKKNVDIHVLTSGFKDSKKIEVIDNVKVFRLLKTGKDPYSFIENIKRSFFEKSLVNELLQLHQKENYDIIHCMNSTSISAVKLKAKIKKPFVLHVNGPILFCPKGTLMYKDREVCEKNCDFSTFLNCHFNSKIFGKSKLNFFIRNNPVFMVHIRKDYLKYSHLISEFDHYMAISSYMKKKLEKIGIKKEKISVVYNIINIEKFLKLKIRKNKNPKILYLGSYSRIKGPHILIKALKNTNYEANFYGSGTLKEYLVKEGIGTKIRINDGLPIEEIPEIMKKHDVLVIPSLFMEAFGRVALEGRAAGKLVVASDNSGIRDVVSNTNGYLFQPGNVDELTNILKNLDFSKITRNDLKKFYTEDIIKKTIKIYEKLNK